MQMHLYVEVWNIMVCKQNVQDPNKHEQTPDVVKERPWHLSDSWEHSVDRRERHRHSHARTHAGTCTHTCMHTDTWHSRTHTHTQTHTRTRRHTHTHARRHTHAHTPRQTRTHTHARTQTHTHAHAHSHAGTHTTRAEGGTPPRLFFGVTVDCSIKQEQNRPWSREHNQGQGMTIYSRHRLRPTPPHKHLRGTELDKNGVAQSTSLGCIHVLYT